MKILRARINDAEFLTQISLAAKAFWQYPESWLNLWKDALTITPEFITANQVFLAESEERTVGFYALILNGEVAWLEHLWVLPDFTGLGIGQKLLADAVQKAKLLGAASIEIESDPNAEGFYRKQGAEKIGESVTEIEGEKRILPILRIEL
jgi:GNAT superfamily N-acetyltransferase